MDYEPGKVPRKEEWGTQTTTQTKTHDPFASNVKLVGDDMTEKDYDTFFEGFKSTNDKPLWEEPKLWQTPKVPTLTKRSLIDAEPKRKTISYNPVFGSEAKTENFPYRPSTTNEAKIEFLPYHPSTDGEAKFQPLPYIPTKDGQAGFINYASTAPQNIQVRNASQNSEETFWGKVWDEIKEPWEDRKNLLAELVRMYGDLSPEAKSAIKTVLDPRSDSNSRESAGKVLENEIKRIHYGRNQYNIDLPESETEAIKWGWKTELADCHQNTAPDDEKYKHIKYVSPDGKREVIFDYTGTKVITEDEDMGTYNYADPDLWLAHFVVDILPWLWYGNTEEDTTERHERLGGSLNFGN